MAMRQLRCPYCDHPQERFLEVVNRWMLVTCESCTKTFEGRRTESLTSLAGPTMKYESRSRWARKKRRDRSSAKRQRKARKRGRR